MLKRNIGILLFSSIVAVLELIRNAQISVLLFLTVMLLLSFAIYMAEQSELFLEKFKKKSLVVFCITCFFIS